MNRRSKLTQHHASVTGSKQSMNAYIKNGIPAAKLNLGFPFYAKWFTLQAGAPCQNPIGCSVGSFENADGSDNGMSGVFTFENFNLGKPPSDAQVSVDGRCGIVDGKHLKCPDGACCSSSMYWSVWTIVSSVTIHRKTNEHGLLVAPTKTIAVVAVSQGMGSVRLQ